MTLCGILAVNAALPLPDYGWMTDTPAADRAGLFVFVRQPPPGDFARRRLDLGLAALAAAAAGRVRDRDRSPLNSSCRSDADKPDLRLLSSLAWFVTLWAWTLRTDNRVMGTTVPAMATLGLAATVDLNDPVLVCFGVFILTDIFLLIHQNLPAKPRARGAPEASSETSAGRLLLAQFAQTGLCALGCPAGGLAGDHPRAGDLLAPVARAGDPAARRHRRAWAGSRQCGAALFR